MTSAVFEAFVATWDALFKKWPVVGNLLKLTIIAILGILLFYGINNELEYSKSNDKKHDTNFDTIASQNRQLLSILEAQNKLFLDKITTLEHRQYELQKELLDIMREVDKNHLELMLLHKGGNKEVAETKLATMPETVIPKPSENIDTRPEQIAESIEQLKIEMSVEVPVDQKTPDEQTQQDAGPGLN